MATNRLFSAATPIKLEIVKMVGLIESLKTIALTSKEGNALFKLFVQTMKDQSSTELFQRAMADETAALLIVGSPLIDRLGGFNQQKLNAIYDDSHFMSPNFRKADIKLASGENIFKLCKRWPNLLTVQPSLAKRLSDQHKKDLGLVEERVVVSHGCMM